MDHLDKERSSQNGANSIHPCTRWGRMGGQLNHFREEGGWGGVFGRQYFHCTEIGGLNDYLLQRESGGCSRVVVHSHFPYQHHKRPPMMPLANNVFDKEMGVRVGHVRIKSKGRSCSAYALCVLTYTHPNGIDS